MNRVWVIILIGFSLWGYWSASRVFKRQGRYSRQRTIRFLTGLLFGSSCLLPAMALLFGRLPPVMLLPLGLSLFLMIPQPCYFESVNLTRIILWARNLLFLLLGLFLLGLALELIPLSVAGMR